jgi:hypothetical protein
MGSYDTYGLRPFIFQPLIHLMAPWRSEHCSVQCSNWRFAAVRAVDKATKKGQ